MRPSRAKTCYFCRNKRYCDHRDNPYKNHRGHKTKVLLAKPCDEMLCPFRVTTNIRKIYKYNKI